MVIYSLKKLDVTADVRKEKRGASPLPHFVY